MKSTPNVKNKAKIIKAEDVDTKKYAISALWKKMAGFLKDKEAQDLKKHVKKTKDEWK